MLPRRAAKLVEVDACIEAFLRKFRSTSKVGTDQEGVYYWNEREVQWELFRHLRERAVSRSIGSEWWFHAEGGLERPAWARWLARKRADIVMLDHSRFKRWAAGLDEEPEYEALFELKVVWSGQGVANTTDGIRDDLVKLARSIRDELTKEGHMVLIDGLDRNGTPYYSESAIVSILAGLRMRPSDSSRLHFWHWPDSDDAVEDASECPWRHYTAHV